MTDSPWLLSSPSRNQRSPAEYPQTEGRNLQYCCSKQKRRSVFFISSIKQGCIFPNQKLPCEATDMLHLHSSSIHHGKCMHNAYSILIYLESVITKCTSYIMTLHKTNFVFQVNSRTDECFQRSLQSVG